MLAHAAMVVESIVDGEMVFEEPTEHPMFPDK